MNWDEIKDIFTFNGSWLDLYVLNTSLSDWQVLFDCLRSEGFTFRFLRIEEEPLPQLIGDIFPIGPDDTRPLMEVDLGGLSLNCHFFHESEIAFDLDPREVVSITEGKALFNFMRTIGKDLGKPVRLTPENSSELAMVEYDPEQDRLLVIG